MYKRSTTASRRAESQARERVVHASVTFDEVESKNPDTGVTSKHFVPKAHGPYRKPK